MAKRVLFSDPGTQSSPLMPEDNEPVIMDSETYRMDFFYSADQEKSEKNHIKMPVSNQKPGMMKRVSLSASMPTLTFHKLNLTKGAIEFSEQKLEEISYNCEYSEEIHKIQRKFIEKLSLSNKKEASVILTAHRLLKEIPDCEEEIKGLLENVISENDPLKLVPLRSKLSELYKKYIDDPEEANDSLFPPLSKLIIFASRWTVTNFSVRDASYAASSAVENVFPIYKNLFSEMSKVLNCDFIDKDLCSALISFLKHFNERVVMSLRWILMNINPHQIVTEEEHNPTMELSISRPVSGFEPLSYVITNPKKSIYNIIERAAHCVSILSKLEGSNIVNSWKEYFETIIKCFEPISNEYSDNKLIRCGALFGKTISVLTKFGPISGKINPELPELVSDIITNISDLDDIIAHSRSGFILLDNIIESLAMTIRKLRDIVMISRDPVDSANNAVFYFNIIKISALANNKMITNNTLNMFAPYINTLTQCASSESSSLMSHVTFQLYNVNTSLNEIQNAFIHVEMALNTLSSGLIRSSKKFKDPQQRRYAAQWVSYANSLSSCVHEIACQKPIQKENVGNIVKALLPLKERAEYLYVEKEAFDLLASIGHLYQIIP